jgi:hypothetical protein
MSVNDGQAAITQPITVGSATATFAANLAHGQDCSREAERGGRVEEDADDIGDVNPGVAERAGLLDNVDGPGCA